MLRNMIVGAFEAFAWLFFIAAIGFCTWYGWQAAESGVLHVGTIYPAPWQGAIGGFVLGTIGGIVGTGLIFTLLDIRAGTDRITWLIEQELRYRSDRDYGDKED